MRLIETFRWEPGAGFLRLPAHVARMADGAATLGFPFDRDAVDRALARVAGAEPLRVRLTLAPDGMAEAEWAPLGAGGSHWTLVVAEARLRSDDPWLRVKTTERRAYDAARAALPAGVDEAVVLNERGEVCEGAITTVFADLGEGLVTPPLDCGLLPGVLRAEMLALGRAREGLLGVEDLARAQLFVGNALRGLIPARLAPAPDRAGGRTTSE
jgi:4-amino-4-deoxychorismate lyase